MDLHASYVLAIPGTPMSLTIDNETIIVCAMILAVLVCGVAHAVDGTTLGNLLAALIGYVFSKIVGYTIDK